MAPKIPHGLPFTFVTGPFRPTHPFDGPSIPIPFHPGGAEPTPITAKNGIWPGCVATDGNAGKLLSAVGNKAWLIRPICVAQIRPASVIAGSDCIDAPDITPMPPDEPGGNRPVVLRPNDNDGPVSGTDVGIAGIVYVLVPLLFVDVPQPVDTLVPVCPEPVTFVV